MYSSMDYTSRPQQVGNTDDFSAIANDDLEYGLKEIYDHQPGYNEARLYASGRSPELFLLSDAARQAIERIIDRYGLNFASLPIAIIHDRVAIMGYQSRDEVALDDIIDANAFWTWSSNVIKDTLIDGDSYVILAEGEDGDPVLNPVQALNTRMIYDNELNRIPEFAIRKWSMREGKDIRANLWYPDRIERYIRAEGNRWAEYSTDEYDAVAGHGFPDIPVVHFRTESPYGVPVHYNAYGPQDGIVKLIMTMMATVELMGWPQRYLLQDPALIGQSTLPGGGNTQQREPGARSQGTSALRGGPGTLWELFGRQTGQYPAADTTKLIEGVSFFVRAMAQVTRVPLHYFDPSGAVPSGESLLVADAPVKASAQRIRRMLTGASDRMMALALSLGTTTFKEDVTTVWAPDPVISDGTWWETAVIRESLGVSRQRIWTEAGYTDEDVTEFSTTPPPQPPGNGAV